MSLEQTRKDSNRLYLQSFGNCGTDGIHVTSLNSSFSPKCFNIIEQYFLLLILRKLSVWLS